MVMSKGKIRVVRTVLLNVSKIEDENVCYIKAYKEKYKLSARSVLNHMINELRRLKGKEEFIKCLKEKK